MIRNDEMASENWFMKRESEKNEQEFLNTLTQKEREIKALQDQWDLEKKNIVLEQKLQWSSKIELLKEEHFKTQQDLTIKLQKALENVLAK